MFILRKRRLGWEVAGGRYFIVLYNNLIGGVIDKMESDLSQRCIVVGSNGLEIVMKEVLIRYKDKIFPG